MLSDRLIDYENVFNSSADSFHAAKNCLYRFLSFHQCIVYFRWLPENDVLSLSLHAWFLRPRRLAVYICSLHIFLSQFSFDCVFLTLPCLWVYAEYLNYYCHILSVAGFFALRCIVNLLQSFKSLNNKSGLGFYYGLGMHIPSLVSYSEHASALRFRFTE